MSDNFHLSLGDSNVLIHAPHGGRVIPDLAYGSLMISPEELKSELLAMTDSYTAMMARDISLVAQYSNTGAKAAGLMLNRLSRLVVDPERFPDEREEMNAVGMGAVYTHGSKRQQIRADSPVITERLVERYFKPYALAMEEAVSELLDTKGSAFIVDLHSYPSEPLPYELHAEGDRPDICLGFDDYHISPEVVEVIKKELESSGYRVGFNSPFAGTYVPLKFYGRDPRVSSLMLEIRRDTYMDELTGSLDLVKYNSLIQTLSKIIDFLNNM